MTNKYIGQLVSWHEPAWGIEPDNCWMGYVSCCDKPNPATPGYKYLIYWFLTPHQHAVGDGCGPYPEESVRKFRIHFLTGKTND